MAATKFKPIDISVQEKFKTDFQESDHLRFPIGMVLTILDPSK